MAAMSTVLTEFSDGPNSRTYTTPAHTATKPCLVIQKRKVASSATSVIEDTVSVVHGTVDAAGNALQQKVVITISVRRPVNGVAADVTAAKTIAKDIMASDNMANTVDTQEYLA